MRRLLHLVLAVVFLLELLPALAWSQVRVGPEFQVNNYTTGSQRAPAVAADANSGFVVVWQSHEQDGSGQGVFGRRYDGSGVALDTTEFAVNSYTTSHQAAPGVASDPEGSFVIVWESAGQDGSAYGVFGRRYDASGAALEAAEFGINSHTTSHQRFPAVAAASSGAFVTVWESFGQVGLLDVFGQRYAGSGTPQGTEFPVSTETITYHDYPVVAFDGGGNFVVVWQTFLGQDVFGRRFDASATPLGSPFRINSHTTGGQRNASVAAAPAGEFVVVWESGYPEGPYAYNKNIRAQRFGPTGNPVGGEFRVNSYTTGSQARPWVALDAGGNFVVVWQSYGQDGNGYGIFGQRFDASGTAQGAEFQVNTFNSLSDRDPFVASDPGGTFVVVWETLDGSGYGVRAQRFAPDLIFEDGFESANLAAWSASATG
jgi:hypothetical protein